MTVYYHLLSASTSALHVEKCLSLYYYKRRAASQGCVFWTILVLCFILAISCTNNNTLVYSKNDAKFQVTQDLELLMNYC